MGAKHMSEQEKKTIEDYIKSGMGRNQISRITGRSTAAISRIMHEVKGTNENVVELPTKEVEKTAELKDTVRDHRDDPRFASNITIEMVAKIVGNKTGYGYRADFGKKILTITTDTGNQLDLEFCVVEKFLDEMIDISVEVGDLKKKFSA